MSIVNVINYTSKTITDLEEMMIIAHRINQFEEGCVFVSDRAHVEHVEFDIRSNKEFFLEEVMSVKIHYGKKSNWNDQEEIKEFKNKLIQLYEKLSTKKVTPPASNE